MQHLLRCYTYAGERGEINKIMERLKKDLHWFEHVVKDVSGPLRMALENPGLVVRNEDASYNVYLEGDMLKDDCIVSVREKVTRYRLAWLERYGWCDRVGNCWEVSAEARRVLYEAYPDLPMLIEIRAAMYRAAKEGALPTGPPAAL